MKYNAIVIALAHAALLVQATALSAQDSIPVSHFDGWRTWPLYEAGDIPLDNAALGSQRTVFDFLIPTGETMTMNLDILAGVHLRGEPAIWVQYTSSGVPGDTAGTSVLDAILVHRETFRVAFRIQPSPGPRSWTGHYALVQHRPDRIIGVSVHDDGSVEEETVEETVDPFDFASMPYLFSFMPLEAGRKFRLLNVGTRGNRAPRPVGIYVAGQTTITDANGREHAVWEVQLLSNNERVLISFYVTDQAPYFYGWHYRNVENGSTFTKMDYRNHSTL